ncbi:hypothetical protein [Comamonas serinivorans]|nr:hypothetical protein [Comamonas serinivorans]
MKHLLLAWDDAVLQRSPVLWQLRLHRCVPLALGVLLAWALTMGLLADPARWLGADGGTDIERHNTPESQALQVMFVTWLVLGLLQALGWLVSARVHNRWRDHLPAGRFALWREWLLGAMLCALLLAPLVLQDRVYRGLTAARWLQATHGVPVDPQRQESLRERVALLEALVAPANAPFVPHWDAVADLPGTTARMTNSDGLSPTLLALRLLKHGQVDTIAQQIAEHAQLLQAVGYVAAEGGSARTQAQALVQAYRNHLNAYQALWQAEEARQAKAMAEAVASTSAPSNAGAHSGSSRASSDVAAATAEAAELAAGGEGQLTRSQSEARDVLDRCDTRYAAHRRDVGVDTPAPEACLHALAALPDAMRLGWLNQQTDRMDLARHARWVHPRHGQAVYPYETQHLQKLPRADDTPRSPLLALAHSLAELAVWALCCALALLAIRLLTWGQLALLSASLVLLLTLGVWLSAVGLRGSLAPALLGLPLLGLGLWRVWRGRPWGTHLCLGGGLAVMLLVLSQALDSLGSSLTGRHTSEVVRWLWGAPAYALCLVALMAALAPAWRRWRSLAER